MATVVRAICMSERMPSCMRAPPEDGNHDQRRPLGNGQRGQAATRIPSPTAIPMEPAMKSKSNDRGDHRGHVRPCVPCGDDERVLARRFCAAGYRANGRTYFLRSRNLSGSAAPVSGSASAV